MPVRLLEVDLAEPLTLEPAPLRYPDVRVLVRLYGAPLGYLELPNDAEALAAPAFGRAAAERLGPALRADRLRRRWGDDPTARAADSDGELIPISVVVCTRGRAGELEGCLAALARQSYPSLEVVVVDNAAADDANRLVAERFEVRYVAEPRPGLDWARNAGLRAAIAPIVAYVDDDARAAPGWLDAVAAGFSSPDVHAVTGLVVPAELETFAQELFEDVYGGMGKGFRPVTHSRRGRTMTYRPHRCGAGCNMAFRRSALEAIGGFDPALDVGTITGGGGDLDVFQRILEADGAIAYRPDAIVHHIHRRTMRQLRRQLFDNGRGYAAAFAAMLARARGGRRMEVLYWWFVWWSSWFAARAIRWVVRRERLPLRLILTEFAGFVVGALLYPAARRRARKLGSSETT